MDVFTAIKKWNEAKGGEFVIPKKGTPEFEEVKEIMKGGKAKKVPDEKKKIVAKIVPEKAEPDLLAFAPLEDSGYLVNLENQVVEQNVTIESRELPGYSFDVEYRYVGVWHPEEGVIVSNNVRPDYLRKAKIYPNEYELNLRETTRKEEAEAERREAKRREKVGKILSEKRYTIKQLREGNKRWAELVSSGATEALNLPSESSNVDRQYPPFFDGGYLKAVEEETGSKLPVEGGILADQEYFLNPYIFVFQRL